MVKDDYGLAKSFRPISLTPFLFKTLERLCYWHIHETALKSKPIHRTQRAFRTGFSTETAISQAVNHIKKGLLRRKYSLAAFIDIVAAFDRLKPDSAVRAMRKRKIDEDIIKCSDRLKQV